jgi:hypothetical protein
MSPGNKQERRIRFRSPVEFLYFYFNRNEHRVFAEDNANRASRQTISRIRKTEGSKRNPFYYIIWRAAENQLDRS